MHLCSPSLEHLKLYDTNINPSLLHRILRLFPSLRSFTYVLTDVFSLTGSETYGVSRDVLDLRAVEKAIRASKPDLAKVVVTTVAARGGNNAQEDLDRELEEAEREGRHVDVNEQVYPDYAARFFGDPMPAVSVVSTYGSEDVFTYEDEGEDSNDDEEGSNSEEEAVWG